MLMHGDQEVKNLIEKHWGTVASTLTSLSCLRDRPSIRILIKAGTGNPRQENCFI